MNEPEARKAVKEAIKTDVGVYPSFVFETMFGSLDQILNEIEVQQAEITNEILAEEISRLETDEMQTTTDTKVEAEGNQAASDTE